MLGQQVLLLIEPLFTSRHWIFLVTLCEVLEKQWGQLAILCERDR